MFWPNTSSRNPRKFPRRCATSRGAWRRRRPLRRAAILARLLLPPCLILGLILTSSRQTRAQGVERSALPPLPGTATPDDQRPLRPEADFPASPSLVPPASGIAASASALPYDLWRGVDAAALERLLAATPLPSPSPTLAGLIARALAAAPGGRGSRLALKRRGLKRAGRVEEIINLLSDAHGPDVPGLAVVYALALFAAGREREACAVELGSAFPVAESEAARAASVIPAYCAALRGDAPAAVQALIREGRARLAQGLAQNIPRCGRPSTSPTICRSSSMPVSNSTVQASGPTLPRQRRRNSSVGSPVTRRRRPSCGWPLPSAPLRSTSSPARSLREPIAKPRPSCPRARSRDRRCGRGCSPPSRPRPPRIFAPNPLPLCWPPLAIRGSRCRSRRLWRRRRRGWSRTRKPISSPRPASGSPRSPATRKALGRGSTPAASACGAGSFCSRRAIRKGRARKPRSRPASTSR